MSTSLNPSIWDGDRPAFPEPLRTPGTAEVLVVGGGLTGLTTALLLARAGVGVAVVEARQIGSGTTGASTAKVSLLQGTKLSRIRARHPLRVARAYVEANHEAQAWLREFCETHGVPFDLRPAATFAAAESEVDAVRDEYDALRAVGLPVRWSDSLDVPFDTHGAAVLDDQVQLDPMDVLHGLAAEVLAHGGSVHEGQRVRSVRRGTAIEARLADGSTVTADRLVIATGAPTLTGWLTGATVSAARSYLMALEGGRPVPGMLISAGQPVRSLRTASVAGRDVLLVGGSGHPVGRARSEAGHLDDLRAWARRHFPDAVETHAWSAQDYGTPDELPIFGPVPGTGGQIHLASGYDKWGMTNAIAAARAISADLLGQPPDWAETIRDRPASARSLLSLARLGLESGVNLTKSLVAAELHTLPRELPEGDGAVGRSGLRPTARSQVDGTTCTLAAVCTHLGGVLRWNDQERSWDCPLHGSRFTAEGEVIEGPATRALARIEDHDHQPAGSGRPSA